jgi:hypothetical protein
MPPNTNRVIITTTVVIVAILSAVIVVMYMHYRSNASDTPALLTANNTLTGRSTVAQLQSLNKDLVCNLRFESDGASGNTVTGYITSANSRLDITNANDNFQIIFSQQGTDGWQVIDGGINKLTGEQISVVSSPFLVNQADYVCTETTVFPYLFDVPNEYDTNEPEPLPLTEEDMVVATDSVPKVTEPTLYSLADVQSVTTIQVQTNSEIADSEYTQYIIELENNDIRYVNVYGPATAEMVEGWFRNSGYTGNVSALIEMAE